MANQHLQMWKISEEQRAALSDSYNHLQVEAIVDMEQQWDAWIKESVERAAQVTKNYEQSITLVTAKTKNTQATCELIVRKSEEDAKATRAELELCRAQIGMDETIIKILNDKHRQQLNRKIEETLGHAWQEWSAQAAELHVLRADAENRRKEGRGFYKMDENNI